MLRTNSKRNTAKRRAIGVFSIVLILVILIGIMAACNGKKSTLYGRGFLPGGLVPGITDNTPPTVSFTDPAMGAVGVNVNRSISATFSEAMRISTISSSTFRVTGPGSSTIAGMVNYSNVTATFVPNTNLAPDTMYTVTITTAVKDIAGNSMAANKTWSFFTGNSVDSTAPMVSYVYPANSSSGVAVNRLITATFNEAMNPLTINSSTFTVHGPGGTPVVGIVTILGDTATFDTINNLASGQTYTATITTGVRDLAGNAMAANYIWSFITGTTGDSTPPTVSFVSPSNGETFVPLDSNVTATFNDEIDPLSVNNVTFIVEGPGLPGPNGHQISGTVTLLGKVATFNPASNLDPGVTYTATLTTGVKDLAGNALMSPYTWSFTTVAGSTVETAPTVSFTVPANEAANVPRNRTLSATFSEPMNPSTITNLTFTLKGPGTTDVSGVVNYSGLTATFDPGVDLAAGTLYTATITTGVKDLSGTPMAANYTWTFTTGTVADTTAPTVSSTVPANLATNVPFNRILSATFSEAMDVSTINEATFLLTGPGITAVSGVVTYAGLTASFDPNVDLLPNTIYSATITTGAKDLAGNALAVEKKWTFTTGPNPDSNAPTVLSTVPDDGEMGVSINQSLSALFSEEMNPLTISTTTFRVSGPGSSSISGAVTYVGRTATFDPITALLPDSEYTATITTGVKDLAGNAMANNYTWTFNTGNTLDTGRPTVVSTLPDDGDVDVSVGTVITAYFSEMMNPLTITTETFMVTGPGIEPVQGTVTFEGTEATFTPDNILSRNETYMAVITTSVTDLAGNEMLNDYEWTFDTGSPAGPGPVNLGFAGEFNILAGSSVTNTDTPSAPTKINGLIGVFPGSAVSGLPNGNVTAEQIHAGDSVAQEAKLALLEAYNDAMSRSTDAIDMPGNLGGLTFTPGLYVNSTSSGISGTGANAIFTLDAQGDENATWIFKMGSTFITDPGTSIVLAGDAKASNIFWVVGSSATFGTNSIFKGNVLAEVSITLGTGVNLEGRALTNTAAVTLDTNTIYLP